MRSPGQPQTAEPLVRQALAVFRRRRSPGHWQIAAGESVLGGCLIAIGRTTEAELLLRYNLEVLRRIRGPEARITRQTHARLASLQRSQDG